MSSIEDLPPELLVHIFVLLLPPFGWTPQLPGDFSPLTLCATCARWRAIALDTPELWSSLNLVGAPTESVAIDKRANPVLHPEAARHWFATARGRRPLSLSLSAALLTTTILEGIHLYRLRLDGSLTETVERLVPAAERLASLHTLELYHPQYHNRRTYNSPPEQIVKLPALRRLTISAPHTSSIYAYAYRPFDFSPHLDFLRINWERLTHLRLERMGPLQYLLPLVGRCAALEECYLSTARVRGRLRGEDLYELSGARGAVLQEVVTLKHLQRLALYYTSGVPAFFRHFRFPALTHLSIGPGHGLPFSLDAAVEILDCLPSIPASLRALSLHLPRPILTPTNFLPTLRRFPTLTELRIPIRNDLLRELASRSDIAPALSNLALAYGATESEQAESLDFIPDLLRRRRGTRILVGLDGKRDAVTDAQKVKCIEMAMLCGGSESCMSTSLTSTLK